MKVKFSWMYLAALVAAFTWTSCEEEDPVAPAVGITEIKVTPEGSAVSYNAAINGYDAVVAVPVDMLDAALVAATIEATPTMGSEVLYNNEPIGAGVVVDLTSPVTLTAKGTDGKTVAYTVTVTRVSAADGDMLVKSSKFIGFPEGLYDYDVTYFNNKFYAITTSVAEVQNDTVLTTVEQYQLFSSTDGINWSEVKYNASTEGVDLPEGQDGYVIGGEGARLAVHNGRMYVLGGARTKAADIYGNEAESMWGMFPAINAWRSFSTADGVNFECDTIASTYSFTHYSGVEMEVATSDAASFLGSGYVNAVSFNGKLFMQGGHSPVYGAWQGARIYAASEDGKNWKAITPVTTDSVATIDVQYRISNALFVYNNKMWCLGGFQNFVTATDAMKTSVWSSEDGENWTMETDTVKGFDNIIAPKALATDKAVYLFGGMVYDGAKTVVSNKVYRSTDCINWEEVETPEAFTARRQIAGVAQGNSAWLFGGITSATTDNYARPVSDTDEMTTETWVQLMK